MLAYCTFSDPSLVFTHLQYVVLGMTETTTPEIVVDWRIVAVVNLVGIGAVVVAAYHAGQTGNWMPLMGTSMLLAFVAIFLTSQ